MEVIFNELDDDAIRMYQEELSEEDCELSTELKIKFIREQQKIYKALMKKGIDGIKLNGLGKDILEYFLNKFWVSSAYGQAYKKKSRRELLRDINKFHGLTYVTTNKCTRESQLSQALKNLITLGLIDLVDEEEGINRNSKVREQNKNKTNGISSKKELSYNVKFNEIRIRLRSANHCLGLLVQT